MSQNKLICFLLILSTLVLTMLNFTMFSQQQMYELEQYQQARVDYNAGNFTKEKQVLTFDNSTMQFSNNKNADFKNGLIISNDGSYHVIDGDKKLIDIKDSEKVDNIYSQYLIYYYTFYLSPVMILSYIASAIGKSIVGIVIIYVIYRIILHKARRDQIYIKNYKFIDYKLSIAVTLLIANIVYSYSSFFVGYKLSIYIYIAIIALSYLTVLKGFKKIKR